MRRLRLALLLACAALAPLHGSGLMMEREFVAQKVQSPVRSFENGTSDEEVTKIRYTILAVANKNPFDLLKARSQLRQIEKEIIHVHPLWFLGTIFSSEELGVAARNIRRANGNGAIGRMKWTEFMKGVTTSLTQEHAKNNVVPYIDSFAEVVNIPIGPKREQLRAYIVVADWDGTVNFLIDNVQREGDPNMIDM